MLQNAKAKGTISSSTIKLVGWKVLKRPGGIFLTRETRKVDMYFDTTLKTQAFVSWKRFLNLVTRTHQGNFVMKIVRFKRKGSNRESRAFLKKYHSFYKRKIDVKQKLLLVTFSENQLFKFYEVYKKGKIVIQRCCCKTLYT